MELALCAPGEGYYTRSRDPFGRVGDFYTASQLQPVFGMLMASLVRRHLDGLGSRTVVELGPGRGEMAPAFAGLDYVPVDAGARLPENFSGVVFANEFFDALPVHLLRRTRAGWGEMWVTRREGRCTFATRTRTPGREVADYVDRYHADAPRGSVVEVNLRARQWVEALTRAAGRAVLIAADYGYTAAEWMRHTQGTLMSYRHHRASEDVLADPGERDITAHVAWTPLEDALVENGWRVESFCTLARTLLEAGESDQFASLFEGCGEDEQLRRRLQLKTLMFGMGETFRVLIASLPK